MLQQVVEFAENHMLRFICFLNNRCNFQIMLNFYNGVKVEHNSLS